MLNQLPSANKITHNWRMLIESVSYRSRKRERLGNFFPCLESFRHAQVGRIANAKRDQMNRKLIMLLASCVLASSISVFAQDTTKQDGMQKEETKQNEMKQDSMGKDEMKQDSMGNDGMKHDQMTEGKKQKKTRKSKKGSKKDAMGKDGMKHGDNVKQSDSMQKDEMQH
jgi:pentapeptide MXKDX repeat protein